MVSIPSPGKIPFWGHIWILRVWQWKIYQGMNKGIYLPRTAFLALHIQSYQLTSVKNVLGVHLLRPNNPKGVPILLIKEILYHLAHKYLGNTLLGTKELPSKGNFGDDFLIPMVGYGLVPWRVIKLIPTSKWWSQDFYHQQPLPWTTPTFTPLAYDHHTIASVVK